MTAHTRTSTDNVAHDMYKLYRTTDAPALSAGDLQIYGASTKYQLPAVDTFVAK